MAEVCEMLDIKKTRITPLNQKSDGFIERFNRTMLDTVTVLLDPVKHQQDWDKVLPYAIMAYRSSVQESTGETPHAMLYGEDMELPIDLWNIPTNSKEDTDKEFTTNYCQELRRKLRATHERVREVLKMAARRQKRNYDKGIRVKPIAARSFVYGFIMKFARKDGVQSYSLNGTGHIWS